MDSRKRRRLIIVTDQGVDRAFEELFDEVLFKIPNNVSKDDVFLFEGGTDVNPKFYGQRQGIRTQFPDYERDIRESLAFDLAQTKKAACLGICRGSQFLTVKSGGKLVQDVTGHTSSHNIRTFDGKFLYVTSTHHQMCYPFDLPVDDYYMLGWAATRFSKHYWNGDNKEEVEPPVEPEIIWYCKTRSLAIQGHPEYMGDKEPFPLYCRNLVKRFIFGEHIYE